MILTHFLTFMAGSAAINSNLRFSLKQISGPAGPGIFVSDTVQAVAGASGTQNMAFGAGRPSISYAIAINPL